MVYWTQQTGGSPLYIEGGRSHERSQAIQKPLAIYYAIVLLVLLVINLVVMPWLAERQVQEVDYGTFMSMTEQENIGKVDIQSNQIILRIRTTSRSTRPA